VRRTRHDWQAVCGAAQSSQPHPRVEHAVQQIHAEVDDQEHHREGQHDALHERIIALRDGVEQQATHTRPGKHGLGDDCAAEDDAEIGAGVLAGRIFVDIARAALIDVAHEDVAAGVDDFAIGDVQRVRLKGGAMLDADLVVAGLGVAPATGMLNGMALRQDGGLDVDARLRVADGLYAAGDIAAFPLRGDGDRVSVEHWRVAQQPGRVAALNMLGRDTLYDAVPYFWTIHYRKRLDYVGHAAAWDEVVVDGDLMKPEFTAFYIRGRHVVANVAVRSDNHLVGDGMEDGKVDVKDRATGAERRVDVVEVGMQG